jgi:hypothetical protein
MHITSGTWVLIIGLAAVLFGGGPLWLAYKARAPRPAESGGVVLRDQQDTVLGLLMKLPVYALWLAVAFGGAAGVYFIGGLGTLVDARGIHLRHGGQLFMLGFAIMMGLFGIGVVYSMIKHLWSMSRLAPGELHAPAWPLPAGEVVKLKYRRGLRGEGTLNGLVGALVLYRVVREPRYSTSQRTTTYHSVRREQERIPLGDGRARIRNGQLTAAWQVRVPVLPPHPMGRLFGELVGTILGAMDRLPVGFGMGEIAPRLEWQLEVHADFEGLPDDDSVFPLVIAEGDLTTRVPQADARAAESGSPGL